MLKRTLLSLLFSANLYAGGEAANCGCNRPYSLEILPNELLPIEKFIIKELGLSPFEKYIQKLSTTEKIFHLVTIPHILLSDTPRQVASVVVAGVIEVAAWIAPTTTVGQVAAVLTAGQYARPYIFQTTKEKLKDLVNEKALEASKAEMEFIHCLKENRIFSPRNDAGRPTACEDIAFSYALVAGHAKLDQRTKAFKTGKCFCSTQA